MHWLKGHTKDVRAVAFTPDGRLVSGGSDKTVRVWAPLSGKCLHTFRAANVVYAVAVAPDGKTVASAGRYTNATVGPSNTVQLWDLETAEAAGEDVWHMEVISRSIWSLAFSADGDYLAAAARVLGGGNMPDGGGGHWWRRRQPLADANFPQGDVYALSFDRTASPVAITHKGMVTVIDHPGGPQRATFPIKTSWPAAAVFLPADGLVVAANSFLYFADLTMSGQVQRIRTGIRIMSTLAASPDGKLLLAGGKPTVECYDAQTRARRAAFDFEIGAVHAVAFAPDGCTFAVAGEKGLLVCDAD